MRAPERYSPAEERQLGAALRDGADLACPRCGAPLDEWPIPPRADVSYVRSRVWLVCPVCRRTAVLDRRSQG